MTVDPMIGETWAGHRLEIGPGLHDSDGTAVLPGAFRPRHRFRAGRPACGRGGDDRGRTDDYNGQPYPIIYRAFSNLRPRLDGCDDAQWYRYTFSDSDFAVEAPQLALSNFDPRHGM
jgi:hypothetical protein